MQFLYHPHAGEKILQVQDEYFHYLFKVHHFKGRDLLKVRNLSDNYLYTYEVMQLEKKYAILHLHELIPSVCVASHSLHLLWAIIEPKVIEKTLPMLNELGVEAISFFYAHFSQRNFKLSLERMQRILIQSSQQCGRSSLMSLEICNGFDEIYEKYAPFYVFDFGGEDISHFQPLRNEKFIGNAPKSQSYIKIMVGPEGGFSPQEREKFIQIITLNDRLILRSQSACVFLASMAKLWNTKKG